MDDDLVHVRVPGSVKRGLEAVLGRNKQLSRGPITLAAAVTEACNTWLLHELPGYQVAPSGEPRAETIPVQILRGIGKFIRNEPDKPFRRVDVRDQLGIDAQIWTASFSPIFQAMRQDEPGGAPLIGNKYRGLIRRIGHGLYRLTARGQEAMAQIAQ